MSYSAFLSGVFYVNFWIKKRHVIDRCPNDHSMSTFLLLPHSLLAELLILLPFLPFFASQPIPLTSCPHSNHVRPHIGTQSMISPQSIALAGCLDLSGTTMLNTLACSLLTNLPCSHQAANLIIVRCAPHITSPRISRIIFGPSYYNHNEQPSWHLRSEEGGKQLGQCAPYSPLQAVCNCRSPYQAC